MLDDAEYWRAMYVEARRFSAFARGALAFSLVGTLAHAGSDHEAAADPDPMAAMETMEPMSHWMTMLHGYVFVGANRQDGPSGDRDFESVSHFMVVSTRRWAGGKLSLLGTFTLEPATIPPQGSPELFQRGETYHDVLLVDRQHPHDLFVQLAAAWERHLSPRTSVRLYLSPWGEPAVGPTAYPHRLSASENPLAPLAHHNQDSTHISASVITAGVSASIVTIEGSVFHGREPDENRWDIDPGPIDSYSGRLTLRPAPGLSVQVSACRRQHPEVVEEGNETRRTASVEYRRATARGFVAAALLLGENRTEHGSEVGDGLEATWKVRSNFLYGRIEQVDRDLFELVNKRQRPAGLSPTNVRIDAATLGYTRDVPLLQEAETGVGAGVTAYRYDSILDPVYGKHPISFQVFLRFRFGAHVGMAHHY